MILVVSANPSVDTILRFKEFGMGKVNRVLSEERYPGGKGVHAAYGIKELGEDVEILGIWAGPEGEWIKEQCEKSGIPVSGITVAGNTRSCFTIKTGNDTDDTEILMKGPKTEPEETALFLEKFDEKIKMADMVVISGSLPEGMTGSSYSRMVKTAHERNVKVMIDVAPDYMSKALKHKPFAIHVNDDESREITKKNDISKRITKLGKHTGMVALTKGKEGLYLSCCGKTIHAFTHIDKVISAVGSGDSLTAGIAVATLRNYSPEETARLGVACGAANCLREELGMFYKKDVEDILNKVEINRI